MLVSEIEKKYVFKIWKPKETISFQNLYFLSSSSNIFAPIVSTLSATFNIWSI